VFVFGGSRGSHVSRVFQEAEAILENGMFPCRKSMTVRERERGMGDLVFEVTAHKSSHTHIHSDLRHIWIIDFEQLQRETNILH